MATTVIDISKPKPSPWDKPCDARHRFRLNRKNAWVLEAEGLHFHTGSAVLLPDYDLEEPDRITGLAVIFAALRHHEDQPERKILCVGHTDTTGGNDLNLRLSWQRAENLCHLLRHDRDAWVESARQNHVVEDYQRVFRWLAEERGWSCDPGEVDGIAGKMTKDATWSFQSQYNEEFDASIDQDGVVGTQTWGAIFDIMMRDLAELLQIDAAELEQRCGSLTFVEDGKPFVGCGELFPVESARQDEYRSETNRRVEILFFDPSMVPELNAWPSFGKCEEDQVELYDPRLWSFEHIECDAIPRLVWVDLQVVDELGTRVANHPLILRPEVGEPLDITMNDDGYWSGRLVAGGRIKVVDPEGRKLRMAAETEDVQPMLTPKIASRTVTDLIVALGDAERVERHRGLRRRYSAPVAVTTARGAASEEPEGESEGTAEGRGGDEQPRQRNWNAVVADNVWLAAGWTDEGKIDRKELRKQLTAWLKAYHPTAHARDYFLEILTGKKLKVVESDGSSLGDFDIQENLALLGSAGAHTVFEFFGAKGDRSFVDMATASRGIKVVAKEAAPEDAPAEGDPPPGKVESELEFVIDPSQTEDFRTLAVEQTAKKHIEILYNLPTGSMAFFLAIRGGTGLLESYPGRGLDDEIHKRNLRVCKTVNTAYEAYIYNYVQRVEAIPSDPKTVPAGEPHPELQLYHMGPPREAFVYPRPAGCSDDQYREILDEFDGNSFKAWKTIAKKLDEIWGKRQEGSLWVVFEFSAEAGKTLGGPFSGSSLKLNWEADSEGRIKMTTPHTIQIGGDAEGKGGKGSIAVEIDPKTGESKTKASVNVGIYGIEGDSTGNLKMSAGPAFSEVNTVTAQAGAGYEISMKDLMTRSWKKRNPGKEVPEWVDGLPDLKGKVGLYFRGVTEGTLMKVFSNSPGFFEMRPRTEFQSLAWDSLAADEQRHLTTLGFDKESWDHGQLPEACKGMYADLDAKQRVAVTHLPVPWSDPEWQPFWRSLAGHHHPPAPVDPEGA